MSEVTQSIDAEALALLCNLEWLEYDGRPYPAALEILRNHREAAHAAGLAAGIAQERERCAGMLEALWAVAKSADEYVNTGSDRSGIAAMVFNLRRDLNVAHAAIAAAKGNGDA